MKPGLSVLEQCGILEVPREPLLVVGDIAPWDKSTNLVTINPTLIRPISRNDPPEDRKSAAEDTLSSLPAASVEVFTDGAADEGVLNGGAGVIVKRNGIVHARLKQAAGLHCSSFHAELVALEHALDFLEHRARFPLGNSIRMCTDSQSALVALGKGPSGQNHPGCVKIWGSLLRLSARGVRVILQYVPGHCGVEGNEQADIAAKEGSQEPQDGIPVSYKAAKALIKRTVRAEWLASGEGSAYSKLNGPGTSIPGDRLGLSRMESVELSRLRTGTTLAVGVFRKRLRVDVSDRCKGCNENALDDIVHLFSCPAKGPVRLRIFGTADILPETALKNPLSSVKYLRALGLLGCTAARCPPYRQ
jgi:ribonuclease HI